MIDNEKIVKMIKNNDYKNALEEMEKMFKEALLNKLNRDKNICENLKEEDFILFLDFCISNFSEYYDLLSYVRNLCFFSEKTDSEKLYELAHAYEVIVD